jgi:hypothetical protein
MNLPPWMYLVSAGTLSARMREHSEFDDVAEAYGE